MVGFSTLCHPYWGDTCPGHRWNGTVANLVLYLPVTRSHKYNDRDHAGLAEGTAAAEEHLPRYFAKAGHVDADPKKTKKDGGGKGNWGRSGDEMHDYDYTFANARRRSNSTTQALADFQTKFEKVEQEPVFEEERHGPSDEDRVNGEKLQKTDSTDTSSTGNTEDEARDLQKN